MIKYVQGDLFDMVEPRVIIPHVCNNENKWGCGFVVPLTDNYLLARTAFDDWATKGYWVDIGEHSYSLVPYKLGHTQLVNVDNGVWVANMIAQVFYVTDGSIRQTRPLYYNKLADCMEQTAQWARGLGCRILAPRFGSVLAGGNWEFVECLIQDIWGDLDVTIVEYTPEKPQQIPYDHLDRLR